MIKHDARNIINACTSYFDAKQNLKKMTYSIENGIDVIIIKDDELEIIISRDFSIKDIAITITNLRNTYKIKIVVNEMDMTFFNIYSLRKLINRVGGN